MSQPNKGINWPTASVSLSYYPKPVLFQTFPRAVWQNEKVRRWDVGIFTAMKRIRGKSDGASARYFIAGATANFATQVGRINNLSAGIDVNYDASIASRLRSENLEAYPWQLGLLAGHEFILGKFLFTQRLGIYLYRPLHYKDRLFHRWGLTYKFHGHWRMGIDLKVHRQVADYTDLRIIYSL
jgi:hypothetical protein